MCKQIGGAVAFVISGHPRRCLSLRGFHVGYSNGRLCRTALYVITAPAAVFNAILEDEITWDDAALALKLTFDERTDRYAHHLKLLLKYMDTRVFRQIEDFERRLAGEGGALTMATVNDGGERFTIQRLCPHAGTDLTEHSVIADGTITCLAHRMQFDLRTGYCINARGYRLKVERQNTGTPVGES